MKVEIEVPDGYADAVRLWACLDMLAGHLAQTVDENAHLALELARQQQARLAMEQRLALVEAAITVLATEAMPKGPIQPAWPHRIGIDDRGRTTRPPYVGRR